MHGHKIDAVMRHSSIVVVGNGYLRDHAIKAGARQVEMLPTSIDLPRYPSPTPERNEMFNIGWSGSLATTRYLHLAHDVLVEVCAHNQARAVLVEPFSRSALALLRLSWSGLKETWSAYGMLLGRAATLGVQGG